MNSTIILKPGREKSPLRRHPWIFSGAIARTEGNPDGGDIVEVRDSQGKWLARGYVNPRSQITVRLLTWDPDEEIGAAFWRSRIASAIAARGSLTRDGATDACRLIHAESDRLPGLIVDRYGDWLVVQLLTLGIDRRRAEIAAILSELAPCRGIFERSDVDVRAKEGLEPRMGPLWGEPPPEQLEIVENRLRFWVNLRAGQKTGFYLDQRENRARLPAYCAGADVLDTFAYSGAFGVYAACGGAARVTLVDESAPALDLARQNLLLNGQPPERHEFVTGNVFQVLRDFRAAGRPFDVVVLDPPKFAPTAQDVERAARAYKDVNLLALQLLRPGGILFSTSCSGAVSADLFQKILFGAALDSGRAVQIIGDLRQSADHPVALTFPEGAYLKGLICRVE